MNQPTPLQKLLEHDEFISLKAELHVPEHHNDGALLVKYFAPDTPPRHQVEMGIGQVVIAFQRLEIAILGFLAAKLLGHRGVNDIAFQAMTHRLSFSNLLLVTEAVAVAKDYDNIDKLRICLSAARRAEEFRNQVVHSSWSEDRRSKISKRGWVFEQVPAGDLFAAASRIHEIDNAVDRLLLTGPGGYDTITVP